ncbi:MAG TPA: L-aspartate oxidase [Candidatus Limnocylindria bacterium]|nr:L-aspartate oxidase [Candidatus Limnocylindria bacterium]
MALQSDVLVIGSGLAGMLCALRCAEHGHVLLVTKDQLPESSSRYAQGGIASVWGEDDTFESHIEDTITAGAGLCRRDAVETVVREGPERVRELIRLGVHFDVTPDSEHPSYDLGREGGHSHRRILHALDQTGNEMVRVLGEAVRAQPNIQLIENHLAVELILDRRGPRPVCWGAYILDRATGRIHRMLARATILCTGGSGKVYLYTSNPDIATGDGLAMAYRAGARVANMEFFQFHPTCLYHPQAKSFLLTEALRGEGALLRRPDGERFMPRYHPLAELAPRDVVARAIDSEMKQHGFDCVYLDISHRDPEWVRTRFPTVYRRCLEFGFDLSTQPVPVVPAAHYQCGGVVTDLHGRTSIARLHAAGEVACTGLHGANRLASNSLLEALVFGHRAGRAMIALLDTDATPPPPHPPWDTGSATVSTESVVVSQDWDEIRRFMWNYVGIVRSNQRLERARKRIALLQDEIQSYYWNVLPSSDLIELRNIATVAELIITCASLRRESRGLHTTIDYPDPLPSEQHDTVVQRANGRTPVALPPGSWLT